MVYLFHQSKPSSQREIAKELNFSVGTVNNLLKELSGMNLIRDGKITDSGLRVLEPYRVHRAILLADGFESRMMPITFNTPAPLVRIKGERIIDTLLDALLDAEIYEVYITRGYLAEQFDQLLYKYPMIKFVENPLYKEANNIASVQHCGSLISNAYVINANLFLRNPKLIPKYQYRSNYLAIPVEHTVDLCLRTENGTIRQIGLGGKQCHQSVGISYWTTNDGMRLSDQIHVVYNSPGGKNLPWDVVPLYFHAKEYTMGIRECTKNDIVVVDSLKTLKDLDPVYNVK